MTMKNITLFIMGLVTIVTVILVIFLMGIQITDSETHGGEELDEPVFQGPVPKDYDLEHFRKTGETIPIKLSG